MTDAARRLALSALELYFDDTDGSGSDDGMVAAIFDALTAAGYRIIGPEDEEALALAIRTAWGRERYAATTMTVKLSQIAVRALLRGDETSDHAH